MLFGIVESKVKVRHTTKLQTFKNFVAYETDGMFKSLDGSLLLFLRAARADKHPGIATVRCKPNFVDHNGNFQARILEFTGKHGVNLVGDFFTDTFVSVV